MDSGGRARDESDSAPIQTPGNGKTSEQPGVANEAGLLALGQQIDSSKKARRSGRQGAHAAQKRHHRVRWTLIVLGTVIVLIAAGVAGYAWYINHLVHRIDVKGLAAGATKGAENGTENILLVGSTDRCALKTQYIGYGICSQGVNGINSDVVMILHLNPSTHSVSILSIPRDLFVPNARIGGANKIDAALYQGPTQLVAAIQEDFGIPIQHYVELNFDSFASVVDALGGIYMYFPEPVYDAESDLNVQTPGCHYLNGFHALQVVRARHLQYKAPGVTSSDPANWPMEGQSDLARIRRDHEFLRVLATAVAKKGLGNPITDHDILTGVAPDLVVDNGLSIGHMLNLVLTYHSVNVSKAPQLTIPVEVDQFGSYQYEGGSYGDIEFPVEPTDRSVVSQFLGISPWINPMTGAALPSPHTVSVYVDNGTDTTDQASSTGAALGALGYHVVGLGDTSPVGQEAETVVYYGSKAPNVVAAAIEVAHSLSGSVILGYNPRIAVNDAQVTVVTGTSFSVTPPPVLTAPVKTHHHATTTTTAAPKQTTTTTTAPSNGLFSAPTSSDEALQPWDPRSCTATGGEGP
jgi:LCP family protein required for cell wall assembly